MGYFDGLTDASFKKDSQGRHVFYPWGIMGKGYILSSEEEYVKTRTFLKRVYQVMIPLIIGVQILFGYIPNLVVIAIYLIWLVVTLKKMTRQWPQSTEKLKANEAYGNSAKSHNLVMLIFLEISSLLFVGLGIWMWVVKGPNLFTIAAAVLFGGSAAAIGYMIVSKLKSKDKK